ncbi:ATP-grasp domain-containing protein [Flagellimonas eckloniae]|uniref:ATP-grasp fold RimK-type domain-containing protein n=1 Tax=Flagellimonas eckloniae TaxID=346185 RepID=A0A0Q0XD07_9FLAO|nr:hypothetical protein [Allomuricauda eckloniae]KQC29025.1 hypothetical protein AAY42_03270 [Allomuricauda eckloniae]
MTYDVVILTDRRYLNPSKQDVYEKNVLLEDELVSNALKEEGLQVARKSWDDPEFDWATTKYALFRATWDYFDRYDQFSTWFKKAATLTKFINSEKLLNWNIDKHYLRDLNENGVHIPRTLYIEPQTKTTLQKSFKKAKEIHGFVATDYVLKPCIAGGARHTYKFHESEIEKYEATFQELIAHEAMMLQEFQENIVRQGELSMMVFNGQFSHAVLKIAKPGDFRVQDDFGGSVQRHDASLEEINFALQTVKAAPELPIYARVDIFRDNDGDLALAELEIFEPELWFRLYPEAANILASSIKKQLFS